MRYILLLFLMFAVPTISAQSSDEFLDLIDATKKSVVFILNTPMEGAELPALTGPFGDPGVPEDPSQRRASGTGFIVEGGYIITNWHVIEDAEKIEVFFEDGRKPYIVTVIGSDEDIDIAVLKTGENFPKNIAPLEWRVNPVRQGEDVFAVGHPLGFTFTVTKGIVSHIDRRLVSPWQPTIQTDVAINKGNSGGPLLDMNGKVIGVNVMLVSNDNAFSGIALSINHNIAKHAIKVLLAEGKISRPLMGVLLSYDEETFKVKAEGITLGGAAETAGILNGDLYLEVDGVPIIDINDVFDILAYKKPQDVVTVKLLRDGVEKLIDVTLSHQSED